MAKNAILLGLVVCSLAVIGCESDDSSSSGSLSLEELPSELAAVGCEKIYDCCSADEREGQIFIGSDVDECTSTMGALFSLISGQITASEKKGRVKYDGAAAAACMDQARAASCAEYDTMECSTGITPLVAKGGACTENMECIDGICIGDDDSADPEVEGTCGAALADGEDCVDDDDCSSEQCDFVDGKCVPKLPDGESCFSDDECESGGCVDDVCGTKTSSCTL